MNEVYCSDMFGTEQYLVFAKSEHTFLKTFGVTFYLYAGLINKYRAALLSI